MLLSGRLRGATQAFLPANVLVNTTAGSGSPRGLPEPASHYPFGRDADDLALRVREHAEGDAGHARRRLDDAAAELLRLAERCLDVGDADEVDRHRLAALHGPDPAGDRSLDAGLDVGVARDAALAVAPAEEVAEEGTGRIRIVRAQLEVDNWCGHDCSSARDSGGAPVTRNCVSSRRRTAASEIDSPGE